MKKICPQEKGMTLVELLVGVALFGIVSVGGIWLMTEKKKQEINGNIQVLAAEMAEQFFKARRDVFATSFEDTGRILVFALFGDPGRANSVDGNTPYRSITIPTSGCFGSFTEIISNECIADNPDAAILGTLNESGLSAGETAQLRDCSQNPGPLPPGTPPPPPGTPPPLAPATGSCPYHRMRVQVRREINGNNVTTDFPLNNQQGVIGAALCIVPNNDVLVARTDPTAYTGINFRLLLVVKDANNRLKLVRKETSFARPRLRQADSIIPSSLGCDKSQN